MLWAVMQILAAFDKFKDSMTARAACAAATAGVRRALGPEATVTQAPLTDGGEGFCDILTAAANGKLETHRVHGPLGQQLEAPLGWVAGPDLPAALHQWLDPNHARIAVIEMAAVAGLQQVPQAQRHPQHCTTYGVGELIRIAAAQGADAILLGIGGSATSDLGLGALQALGLQFLDAAQQPMERLVPAQWAQVAQLSAAIAHTLPPLYIACDVDNPLLGPRGAAAPYGPQKGLPIDQIETFDAAASRLAEQLCEHFQQPLALTQLPGSGAAGGLGFGLKVACRAQFVPGFELVSAWLDLPRKIAAADLVLSGEGKIDHSSLSGKGPVALLRAAQRAGKPSLLLAGAIDTAAAADLRAQLPQCQLDPITPPDCALAEALARGAENLSTQTERALRALRL